MKSKKLKLRGIFIKKREILSHWKFFCQINSSNFFFSALVKPLLSRNFCQKSMRENFCNFHCVSTPHCAQSVKWKIWSHRKIFRQESRHLFSNFFSKSIAFTKVFAKRRVNFRNYHTVMWGFFCLRFRVKPIIRIRQWQWDWFHVKSQWRHSEKIEAFFFQLDFTWNQYLKNSVPLSTILIIQSLITKKMSKW